MDAEDAAQAARRLGQARSLLRFRRAGTLPQGRSERGDLRARRGALRAGYQGRRNCRARTRLPEVAEVRIRAAEGFYEASFHPYVCAMEQDSCFLNAGHRLSHHSGPSGWPVDTAIDSDRLELRRPGFLRSA